MVVWLPFERGYVTSSRLTLPPLSLCDLLSFFDTCDYRDRNLLVTFRIESAPDRRTKVVGIGDWAFRMESEPSGNTGEIDVRIVKTGANPCAIAVKSGEPALVDVVTQSR